jgi:flagellum-specific ATP synthase/type III secretion protein N (ATPase)
VKPAALPAFDELRPCIEAGARPFYLGRVARVSGVIVEAHGVPAAIGELCRIRRPAAVGGEVDAEVVGFRGTSTLLMPHGELAGLAPMQPVIALRRPFCVPVGDELLGRVLDGFGRALDGAPEPHTPHVASVQRPAPDPLERLPITDALQTGVRAIDAFCALGRGQRLGVFSGSGVGKSSLLGQIVRGTDAGAMVVCLVGERGREVGAFLSEVLGPAGRARSAVVVATSDRPPIERFMAPFVAVTLAEHFRDQGRDVLLVMDSVTRFAGAAREIGLAAGEPPTVRGYPPSFFATMPKLVERMGRTRKGSITGLLTILLDGDDPNDPVADTLRGLLDGHVLLARDLANRGHFPAVDVLASLSRLAIEIVPEESLRAASRVREMLAVYREGRDLVEIGAYKPGSNRRLDAALAELPAIDAFLRQPRAEHSALEETRARLASIARSCEQRIGGVA